MDQTYIAYLKQLYDLAQNDDIIPLCNDVINELEKLSSQEDVLEPIFCLFEAFPDADFGNPGPLVHYLEKFEHTLLLKHLLRSLERKPTLHTLWMLNRQINGSSGDEKLRLIDVMAGIANRAELEPDLITEAAEYLEYQQKRITFFGQ